MQTINPIIQKLPFAAKAIDAVVSERLHQIKFWNENTTATKGKNSDSEFLIFIQDYFDAGVHILSKNGEPYASQQASENLRKICALVFNSAQNNNWEDYLFQNICSIKEGLTPKLGTALISVPEFFSVIKNLLNNAFSIIPFIVLLKDSTKIKELQFILSEIAFYSLFSMELHHAPVRYLES